MFERHSKMKKSPNSGSVESSEIEQLRYQVTYGLRITINGNYYTSSQKCNRLEQYRHEVVLYASLSSLAHAIRLPR